MANTTNQTQVEIFLETAMERLEARLKLMAVEPDYFTQPMIDGGIYD